MHLLLLIPGFGAPHAAEKIQFLRRRLLDLHAQSTSEGWTFDAWLFVYDDTSLDAVFDGDMPPLSPDRVRVVRSKGILAEFLIDHCSPSTLREKGYTHVLVTVDDVEFVNVPISTLRRIYDEHRLDILAPALTADSRTAHPHMRERPPVNNAMTTNNAAVVIGRIVNALEWFCYFVDLRGYERWWGVLDRNSPWTWGVDLILHTHFDMRLGILDTVTVRHYYSDDHSEGTGSTPTKRWFAMLDWLQQHKFKYLDPQNVMLFGQTLADITDAPRSSQASQ